MLAMTTTQAVWVLDYDSDTAWQIDCGKGVYYGISFMCVAQVTNYMRCHLTC
jgi:hypothetical protein